MNRLLVIAGLALLSSTGMAQTKAKPMSDAAMDRVTASGVKANVTNGVVNFTGQTSTPNGVVSSNGSMALQSGALNGSSMGTLSLNGQAQQNLSSLININAANSKINVLLNLNVNINSTVGTITQTNFNGKH